jgi:hypothetical protein
MKEHIGGRVARMNLTPSKALWPLFEAVSNAIDAIQAGGGGGGSITVELVRDTSQTKLGDTDRSTLSKLSVSPTTASASPTRTSKRSMRPIRPGTSIPTRIWRS